MKRYLLLINLFALLLSGCSSIKKLETNDDDVYLDPQRDKNTFYPKPAEPAQVADNSATNSRIAATEADKNNPNYKDKDFSYDDYYDNEYAARLKRFQNPMYGVGYYDNYYTNSYFYNQNPYHYGVSIYNGYNWWGQSYNNYSYVQNYNWGGWYGNGSYNNCNYNPYNYAYSNWAYSPYNNYYNPYSFGNYNNPYYSPYNNFYGYNNYYSPGYTNSYDHTSNTYYGPRMNHTASNSTHVINPTASKLDVKPNNPDITNNTAGADPTNVERFHQISMPEEVKTQAIVKGNTQHANNTGAGSNPGQTTINSHQHAGQPQKEELNMNSTPQHTEHHTEPKKSAWWNSNGSSTSPSSGSSNNATEHNTEVKPSRDYNSNTESTPVRNNSTSFEKPQPATAPQHNNTSGNGSLRPR